MNIHENKIPKFFILIIFQYFLGFKAYKRKNISDAVNKTKLRSKSIMLS